jgi:iron-sulfur cluster repair protein YtfE (RIC family)
MPNHHHDLTNPAPGMLAPISGVQDHVSGAGPSPAVRMRLSPRIPRTLFTHECRRTALVAAYPELKQVCDQIGFGSDMSLSRWCQSPEWALLVLARAAKPPPAAPACDWSQVEIFELIDDLMDQHSRLRNELQRLDILARTIVHRHADAGIMVGLERSFANLRDSLVAHIALEEAEVFPQSLAIEAENRGRQSAQRKDIDVTSGIRAMRLGHDDAEVVFALVLEHSRSCMQEVADMDLDLLRLGLIAINADYLAHATMEDEILVPAAIFAEDQLRARTAPPEAAAGPRAQAAVTMSDATDGRRGSPPDLQG